MSATMTAEMTLLDVVRSEKHAYGVSMRSLDGSVDADGGVARAWRCGRSVASAAGCGAGVETEGSRGGDGTGAGALVDGSVDESRWASASAYRRWAGEGRESDDAADRCCGKSAAELSGNVNAELSELSDAAYCRGLAATAAAAMPCVACAEPAAQPCSVRCGCAGRAVSERSTAVDTSGAACVCDRADGGAGMHDGLASRDVAGRPGLQVLCPVPGRAEKRGCERGVCTSALNGDAAVECGGVDLNAGTLGGTRGVAAFGGSGDTASCSRYKRAGWSESAAQSLMLEVGASTIMIAPGYQHQSQPRSCLLRTCPRNIALRLQVAEEARSPADAAAPFPLQRYGTSAIGYTMHHENLLAVHTRTLRSKADGTATSGQIDNVVARGELGQKSHHHAMAPRLWRADQALWNLLGRGMIESASRRPSSCTGLQLSLGVGQALPIAGSCSPRYSNTREQFRIAHIPLMRWQSGGACRCSVLLNSSRSSVKIGQLLRCHSARRTRACQV